MQEPCQGCGPQLSGRALQCAGGGLQTAPPSTPAMGWDPQYLGLAGSPRPAPRRGRAWAGPSGNLRESNRDGLSSPQGSLFQHRDVSQ